MKESKSPQELVVPVKQENFVGYTELELKKFDFVNRLLLEKGMTMKAKFIVIGLINEVFRDG